VKKGKYDLSSYDKLLNEGVRYINVWRFKQFLFKKNHLKKENDKFVYCSLENKKHLFSEYYIEKPVKPTDESDKICKEQKKLWSDLQKARHEDCLLYTMAIKYFTMAMHCTTDMEIIQQSKASVQTILNIQLKLTQKSEDGQTTYTVSVPIKDVEKWLEIQNFDKQKKLLNRLPVYLTKNGKTKELKDIANNFSSPANKEIALSNLSKVNNHIINNQVKFTNCIMALEEFYIWKHKLTIAEDSNRLEIGDISGLKSYPGLENRNEAFHFDLPMDKTYRDVFTEIEKRFAQEINKGWTIETLPCMHRKVMEVFLDKMRNDIFDKSTIYQMNEHKKKKDIKETRKKALENYLKELQRK
jgi:hypothetical protein